MNNAVRLTDPHATEARLAMRLAAGLTAGAEMVPHDVAERLRVAREQALARSRLRLATPAALSAVGVSAAGAAMLGGFAPWWQRAASLLPLLLLVSGLVLIDHWVQREQVLAAADIDAQLLSDNLPPAAYSDPGFVEYLRTVPPQ
jgi:hypothetical protein